MAVLDLATIITLLKYNFLHMYLLLVLDANLFYLLFIICFYLYIYLCIYLFNYLFII